jgi:hypothetical protein
MNPNTIQPGAYSQQAYLQTMQNAKREAAQLRAEAIAAFWRACTQPLRRVVAAFAALRGKAAAEPVLE